MLSIFPSLFTYQLLVPTVFRLAAGGIFFWFGYSKLWKEREQKRQFFEGIGLKPGMFFVWFFGLVELSGGILLIAGYLTQPAALALSLIALGAYAAKATKRGELSSSAGFLFLLFLLTASLLFLGPGKFAFDLPL